MAQTAADYARLRPLTEEQSALSGRLEAAMARWEELAHAGRTSPPLLIDLTGLTILFIFWD